MKVLWVCNIIFPDMCEYLGLKSSPLGGWMVASAKFLVKSGHVQLAITSMYNGKDIVHVYKNNIDYYMLPLSGDITRYHKSLQRIWKKVIAEFTPELVHIHGTENAHSLPLLEVYSGKKVVSIQGLVSAYYYYYGGLSYKDIVLNLSLRDLIFRSSIIHGKKSFARRAIIEKKIISNTHHIIGRTDWDKAHVLAINKTCQYHKCNESLRNSFYVNKWVYEKCHKNTLFVSQGHYPLKGLHWAIKAISLLVKDIPDIHLYVGGPNIVAFSSMYEKLKISGYGLYIKRLIKRFRLQSHITFLGMLDETQMLKQYLSANIYICPSSIENSPNSLCEAQILGVPNISSYVGGIPSLVQEGKTGFLYPFGEYEMLAERIKDILWQRIPYNIEISGIEARHNRDTNTSELLNIYEEIYEA